MTIYLIAATYDTSWSNDVTLSLYLAKKESKHYKAYKLSDKIKAQIELFTDTQHCDHFMISLKSEIALTIIKRADQLTTYHSIIKLTSCIEKSQKIWIKLNHSINLTTNSVNRKTEKWRFKR